MPKEGAPLPSDIRSPKDTRAISKSEDIAMWIIIDSLKNPIRFTRRYARALKYIAFPSPTKANSHITR